MLEVRRLRSSDNRNEFSSGNTDLDRFFIRYAGQNQFRHHIGTTYVAVEDHVVKGFVTVSASHIEIANLPDSRRKGLLNYPLPILRLARLATGQAFRGEGIGLLLLRAVFTLARDMSDSVGCVGVVVDAKPAAVEFYGRFGFQPLELLEGELQDRPAPISLFLPLSAIPQSA